MIESPRECHHRPDSSSGYPAENLARYQFHTGAELRPIGLDEPCPILFRDIGPVAMRSFLQGTLVRLAGPYTPITYMRTEAYLEPYTDHEAIGRLIFLRPLLLHPWHSGVPGIYVARATRTADMQTVGFIPGSVPLADAARLAQELSNVTALREALGGRDHDEAVVETAHRLDRLAAELAETERSAEPMRRLLQSGDPADREQARRSMESAGLIEDDLCTAWHHLPRERRALVRHALLSLGAERCHDLGKEGPHA